MNFSGDYHSFATEVQIWQIGGKTISERLSDNEFLSFHISLKPVILSLIGRMKLG